MNEIEKMYENAGVEKVGSRKCTTTEYLDCQNYCFISENNKCDKFSYDYPPFTAEKQIELIKWLSKNKHGIGIDLFGLANPNGETVWNIGVEFQWEEYNYVFEHKDFEEALAGLVNQLWQDLTEEEKQQIKEILE